jgi:hypothetical protein
MVVEQLGGVITGNIMTWEVWTIPAVPGAVQDISLRKLFLISCSRSATGAIDHSSMTSIPAGPGVAPDQVVKITSRVVHFPPPLLL